MLAFLAVRGIAPLALDVLILGAGGLPTGAGTETDLEVTNYSNCWLGKRP